MNIKDNIIKILEPLDIYDFSNQSTISNEIETYSKPLQLINESIDRLKNESFIQTAQNEGLHFKEELLSLSTNVEEKVDIRREKIIYALSTNTNHFNKQGIINSAKYTGFDINISENIKEETITITSVTEYKQKVDITHLKEQITKMLPAHLDIIFKIDEETTFNDIQNMVIDSKEELSWSDLMFK